MKKKRRAGAQRKRRLKKSHMRGEGMREAYDLKKKRRRRKGREGKKTGHQERLKSSNLFSAIGTLSLLTDSQAIYNTSIIKKMRKLYLTFI